MFELDPGITVNYGDAGITVTLHLLFPYTAAAGRRGKSPCPSDRSETEISSLMPSRSRPEQAGEPCQRNAEGSAVGQFHLQSVVVGTKRDPAKMVMPRPFDPLPGLFHDRHPLL